MTYWNRPHKHLEDYASYGFLTYDAFERVLFEAVTAGKLAVMYRGLIMPERERAHRLPPGKSFDHRTDYGLPPDIELNANELLQLFGVKSTCPMRPSTMAPCRLATPIPSAQTMWVRAWNFFSGTG